MADGWRRLFTIGFSDGALQTRTQSKKIVLNVPEFALKIVFIYFNNCLYDCNLQGKSSEYFVENAVNTEAF